MSPFLLYMLRSGLYLSLFYAFYLLVMRRTSFFRLNRTLLLAGSYLCLLLPLIRLRTITVTVLTEAPTLVGVEGEAVTAEAPFPWQTVLLGVYLAGMLGTLVLYGVSAWKMGRLMRKGGAEEREGCRLVLLDEDVPSFSWGRTVVMSRRDLAQTGGTTARAGLGSIVGVCLGDGNLGVDGISADAIDKAGVTPDIAEIVRTLGA